MSGTFLRRVAGVFALRPTTFEAIAVDRVATRQALVVVALVGAAAGISALIRIAVLDLGSGLANTLLGWIENALGRDLFSLPNLDTSAAFVNGLVGAFVFWLAWTAVAAAAGRGNPIGLARIIGFAQAPRLLLLLGFIPLPFFGILMSVISWGWALSATWVGVRGALDGEGGRALTVVALGLAVALVLNYGLFGPLIGHFF